MKYFANLCLTMMLSLPAPAALADSYRYMHVTIDTPWVIFLMLLIVVLLPFILMAVLYWHNAFKRTAEDEARAKANGEE